MRTYSLADLAALEGQEIGRSDWVVVTQDTDFQTLQAAESRLAVEFV